MAFRVAAIARPLPSSTPSTLTLPSSPLSSSPRASSLSKPPPRTQFRPISVSLPTSTSTAISLFSLLTVPNNATATTFPKEQIVSSITEVEKAIDQVQEVGSSVLNFSQHVLEAAIDSLKPGFDFAVPIVQKTGDQALKVASPVISEALKRALEAIQSSGLDTEPVVGAAKTVADAAQQTTKVIEVVKPIASSAVQTIISADPIVIVGTSGAVFLTYLLLPPIWSIVSFNLRGYKGDLTPAQTLDMLCTQNHFVIDIRSEKDKSNAGIPRLPSIAQKKMISIPLEELPSKLKGLVKNVKKVEAEIAALKISYLKRINKGSNIVIMDTYSDSAKIVARTLTSLGFKNSWVMADGFSGNRGWLQSRLGSDSYNVSFAEVLSPSRVIPAGVKRFGSISSPTLQSNRKLLPGSSDN